MPNLGEMKPGDLSWSDYSYVTFEGGPLDGQTRRMEVYVATIPVFNYELPDSEINQPRAFYINVNAQLGSDDLRPRGKVHYKFYVDGHHVR